MSDSSVWDGVAERLEALRAAYLEGRAEQVFGVAGHEFRCAPPLSPAELVQVEGQFGVRLPADYRNYLLRVASGGAGPGYGLFVLSRDAAGRWGWTGDGAELTALESLQVGFAPTEPTAELARLDAAEPSPSDDSAYGAWLDQRADLLWEPDRTRGAICLAHEGCGYRQWLAVSGPHRGLIWEDGRVADADLALIDLGTGAASFAAWFLAWLGRAEAAVAAE